MDDESRLSYLISIVHDIHSEDLHETCSEWMEGSSARRKAIKESCLGGKQDYLSIHDVFLSGA